MPVYLLACPVSNLQETPSNHLFTDGRDKNPWSILQVEVDSFPGVLYRPRFQSVPPRCASWTIDLWRYPEELTLTLNSFKILCLMKVGCFRLEAIAGKSKESWSIQKGIETLNTWRKCMGIEPTREAINPSHRIWSPGGPPVPYPLPEKMVHQKQARILIGVDHENNSLL